MGIAAVFSLHVHQTSAIPSGAKAFQTPWWEWLGGLFDAVYWLLAIVLASQLDAATLTIKRSARWRFSNDSSALGTRAK
jgi:uncharacterized membrane protein YdcZ (DUF606 family)